MNLENNRAYKKLSINDFKLQKITDVYSDIQEGKDVYFLDGNNEPVKVKSMTKENYKGKIYDVDVTNDIVFVKRVDDISVFSCVKQTVA